MTLSLGLVAVAASYLAIHVLLSLEIAVSQTSITLPRGLAWVFAARPRKRHGRAAVGLYVAILAVAQWVMFALAVDQARPDGGPVTSAIAATELVLAAAWTVWLVRRARARR